MARELRDSDRHANYLGDGLYALPPTEGRRMITLFASNGSTVTDEVFLEPDVYRNLVAWARREGWHA